MAARLFKAIAFGALSIAFLWSGITWAFEGCTINADHLEFSATEAEHDSHVVLNGFHSRRAEAPVIHCLPVTFQADPVVVSAQFKLTRSGKSALLRTPSFAESVSSPTRIYLWRETVFKSGGAFSMPDDGLSGRLVFSILQI